MASAASPLSFAATGLQAVGSFMSSDQSGQQQSQMDEFRAQQLADAAQYGKAQADQTDTFMRNRLYSSMYNIAAVRASANTDPTSPTGNAILNRTMGQGEQERAIKVGDLRQQAQEDQTESMMYAQAGQQASSDGLFGGLLGGLGKLATGLSGLKPS